MDRMDAIRLFIRVVETGSFSMAAKEAGVGQSVVSKQIDALESRLRTRLLNRSSRSLALSEPGRVFYEGCLRLTDDLTALEAEVRRGQSEPSGVLRVAVAPLFGRLYIVPHLPVFFARFPAIQVELVASERHVNMIEENIDLAIRHGVLADSSMAVRALAQSPLVTVASRDYLKHHGMPEHPSDLDRHIGLTFTDGGTHHAWVFAQADGSTFTHQPRGPFRTNDDDQLRDAALAGLGIAQLPAWIVRSELAQGRLQPILRSFAVDAVSISALYPTKRRLNAKLDVFLDFLAQRLAQDLSHSDVQLAGFDEGGG